MRERAKRVYFEDEAFRGVLLHVDADEGDVVGKGRSVAIGVITVN